jgi:trehalose 6-phosphate phosphatase
VTPPYTAVISDMDGVLTRTADLHRQAWKRVFDEALPRLAPVDGGRPSEHEPFSDGDYRAHVDGKPRYDGVADFLASRGIALPQGTPSDPPDADTVCGIGNRKDDLFKVLLDGEGVRVFEDAVAAIARWRRGGVRIAIVSASRNCREVLRAAGLEDSADAIVDGRVAAELALPGKRGILLEAARRLGVEPGSAVVLEDATAGARAARRAGFGRIVGVSRNAPHAQLLEAGADEVVDDVFRTAFPRRLPSALEAFDAFTAWVGNRTPAVFLDFDGTLTPIVDDPGAARLPERTRAVLAELVERCPVAIVSGRDRRDVTSRADVPGLLYAGNHGFDIVGGSREHTLPEAEAAVADVRAAEARLRAELADRPGVIIESKRFSVAVHYRQVREADAVEKVKSRVHAAREGTRLRVRTGKMVLELEPDVPWNKGRALAWLMDVMNLDTDRYFPLYIGDDDTDEDAFAVLPNGAGILVGPEVATTLADYRLADPAEVHAFLERLKTLTSS